MTPLLFCWINIDDFDKGYLYRCELGGPLLTIDDTIEKLRQTNKQTEEQNQLNDLVTKVTNLEQSQDDDTIINNEKIDNLEIIDPNHITLLNRIHATEPNNAICILNKKDTSITFWTFCNSGYRLLIGFNDGTICIQLLDKPFDLTKFKGYWMYRLHDNQRGRVNQEMQDKEIKEYRARIPSTFDTSVKVHDIIDPKAYSIEETKQKSEHDRLVELAERKKAETRQKVAELKDRLRKLKEQNNRLPERIRLPTEAFNLVPQIRYDLLKDRETEIDLVYRETAWETEKNRLALEKLENVFIKPLDCDRITVKAFCSGHCVTSIRMNKLSEEHMKAYDEIISIREKSLSKEKEDTVKHSTQLDVTSTLEHESEKIKNVTNQVNTSIKGARGLRIAQKLHLLEESRRKRDARRAQWKQLEAMKPADDYEDPRDMKEIQLAKEKIGDYKLKSATNYVIPESMKLNTFEAKYKLLNLVDHVYQLSHEFNVSLIGLRNKKMKIIENLKKIDKQLKYINCNLPLNEYGIRLHIDKLDEDEYPERKFIYNNEILLNFKENLETNKQTEQTNVTIATTMKKPSNKILSFTDCIPPEERCHWKEPEIIKEFRNLNTIDCNDETDTIDVIWFPLHCLASDYYNLTILNNSNQKYSLLKPSLHNVFDEIEINQSSTMLPSLEMEYEEQKCIKAIYYRNHLLQLASRLVRCFDREIHLFRHQRYQLGVLLKRSELYQCTLYNEYCLLKEFEKSEYKDLERLSEREHQIHEEFKTSLDDSHKFIEFLTKVFKKRIKRKKQELIHSGSEDESEESSSSSSDDDDDSSYEEIDDENEDVVIMDLDTCPPGCPMEDFERTCLIREKRLDVEEEMTEEKKTLDILRKDLDIFTKKQRVVETTLKQAQNELEAFQKEIEKLSALCDKEMNDKFGRIDDIEKMESVIVNPKLEDLTTKMLALQEEFTKEEANIEAKIRDARDSCMGQIRQNTVYLTKLLTLFNENQQLQNDLNQANGAKIGTIQSSLGIVDSKQLKQLSQLVKLQSDEINSLTQEIQKLSR
uniref:WD repeat-containing protein 52 n=1 Tax=Schistosoma haematobium TaxID=6185 RepID=A0A094ZWY7_SCHHA